MGLTWDKQSTTSYQEFWLVPGVTKHWRTANLSFEFSTFGLPPLPVLNGNFLLNDSHAALVAALPGHLHCGSRESAENFTCALGKGACEDCHTHHEEGIVTCTCHDGDMESIFDDPLRRLPLSVGQLKIRQDAGRVWAVPPYSPINLIVKMNGTRLAVEHMPARCTLSPNRLRGCYACRTGGRLNYTCRSSMGEAMASIICKDGTGFATRCTPSGHPGSVVLSWDHPRVDTECSVDCSGGITTFSLQGTLVFLSRKWEGESIITGNETSGYGWGGLNITMPQIKFVLTESLGTIPQAVMAIFAGLGVIVVMVAIVRYCPLTLLLACCSPAPPAAAAAIAMEVVETNRRQATDNSHKTRTM